MSYHPSGYYNLHDLQRAARRILPRGLYDFLARGSEDDLAVRRNHARFEAINVRTRVLVDVSQRSQAHAFFGRPSSMPIAIAPTGLAGLLRYDGEMHVARAAARAGIPYTISTASIVPLERVAEEVGGRLWFQLYLMPDKDLSLQMVRRAKAAGYEALIVTVDTPAAPNREYLNHSGFLMPMRVKWNNTADVLLHPRWLFTVLLPQLLRRGRPGWRTTPARPASWPRARRPTGRGARAATATPGPTCASCAACGTGR